MRAIQRSALILTEVYLSLVFFRVRCHLATKMPTCSAHTRPTVTTKLCSVQIRCAPYVMKQQDELWSVCVSSPHSLCAHFAALDLKILLIVFHKLYQQEAVCSPEAQKTLWLHHVQFPLKHPPPSISLRHHDLFNVNSVDCSSRLSGCHISFKNNGLWILMSLSFYTAWTFLVAGSMKHHFLKQRHMNLHPKLLRFIYLV